MPSIPAIPTISPLRTVKDKLRTASKPRSFFTTKFSTASITSLGLASVFSVLKLTERPTIISASSLEVVVATSTVSIDSPRRITVQRSATFLISSNLWVIIMIDLPSSAKALKVNIKSSISCGVNTAVGSSKIRISAPRYNVLIISARCCIPTLMVSTLASGSIDKP